MEDLESNHTNHRQAVGIRTETLGIRRNTIGIDMRLSIRILIVVGGKKRTNKKNVHVGCHISKLYVIVRRTITDVR